MSYFVVRFVVFTIHIDNCTLDSESTTSPGKDVIPCSSPRFVCSVCDYYKNSSITFPIILCKVSPLMDPNENHCVENQTTRSRAISLELGTLRHRELSIYFCLISETPILWQNFSNCAILKIISRFLGNGTSLNILILSRKERITDETQMFIVLLADLTQRL